MQREESFANEKDVEKLAETFDGVGFWLLEGITLEWMCLMSNLTVARADKMLPSELQVVAEACKAANPDFFEMRRRQEVMVVAGATQAAKT